MRSSSDWLTDWLVLSWPCGGEAQMLTIHLYMEVTYIHGRDCQKHNSWWLCHRLEPPPLPCQPPIWHLTKTLANLQPTLWPRWKKSRSERRLKHFCVSAVSAGKTRPSLSDTLSHLVGPAHHIGVREEGEGVKVSGGGQLSSPRHTTVATSPARRDSGIAYAVHLPATHVKRPEVKLELLEVKQADLRLQDGE